MLPMSRDFTGEPICTRAKPIPSPLWACSDFEFPCVNSSKILGMNADGMPMPVSETDTTTSEPSRRAFNWIRPPGSMNFDAFWRMLART